MHYSLSLIAALCGLIAAKVSGQAPQVVESSTSLQPVAEVAGMPEVAHLSGGRFLFGSPVDDENAYEFRKCEKPQRELNVDEFWLGRFLVMAEEFCIFLNEAGAEDRAMYEVPRAGYTDWATIRYEHGRFRPRPTMERCPAFPVTWGDAESYCRWLSKSLQHEFRLPTEIEWEYAARGPELRRWPWGDEPPLEDRSRYEIWLRDEVERRSDALVPEVKPEDLGLGQYVESRTRQLQVDPPSRGPDSPERALPIYALYGERWIHEPYDAQRAWLKYPVGTFPKNCSPQGIYDLLAYLPGQWCRDGYVSARALDSEWDHSAAENLKIVRGAHRVIVDRDVYTRTTPFLLRLISAEAGPAQTDGRSWSRKAQDVRRGALLRVASSSAPKLDRR